MCVCVCCTGEEGSGVHIHMNNFLQVHAKVFVRDSLPLLDKVKEKEFPVKGQVQWSTLAGTCWEVGILIIFVQFRKIEPGGRDEGKGPG